MSDNFHSADCGLRLGQTTCTCGFVKPRSDKEIISELKAEICEQGVKIAKLRADLDKAKEFLFRSVSALSVHNIFTGLMEEIMTWLTEHPEVEK
jgi:hypothetical protein